MDQTKEIENAAYDYYYFMLDILNFLDSADNTAYNRARFSYYGLDDKRSELHNELCKALNISKEKTKLLTDNMYQFDCFDSFLSALLKLKKINKDK